MMVVNGGLTANFGLSAWLLLAPAAALLVAAWVLHQLPKMFFDMHLRQRVRRLLPFLDPFVSIDISSAPGTGTSLDEIKSSDAYEEVKAYLSVACAHDARELHADGAAESNGFVLSLHEGQEVADEFQGAAMWWASLRLGKDDNYG